MLAAARSVPSSAESYAFRAQKRAQAAKRAEEKRIVQETHLNLSSKTMSVKNLRDMLASGDGNGDGDLDYAELTNIDPLLYESLGLKSATALLRKFDYNNDGQLDIEERRSIIGQLIPQLGLDAQRLNQTGEYTSASFLWQNLKSLKGTLKSDHRGEVATLQEKFAGRYEKVEAGEEEFYRQRVGELDVALTADWAGKAAFLERVYAAKFAMLRGTRSSARNPTGPSVTKFPPEALQIRSKLRSLSRLKRPDELQLLEGNRLQAMLHAMEDNAHAKHATLAPAHYLHEERALTAELAQQRNKLEALRIKSFARFEKFSNQARVSLDKRHRAYHARMDHAHRMGMHELVLEDVRPVRTLPILPSITSKLPTTAHIGRGGLDRLSNGLSAYCLPADITPPPGHILRVTAAGAAAHFPKPKSRKPKT